METVQLVLMIVGAVAIGLPALVRAILMVLVMIPGDQGEAIFEKVLEWADKIGDIAKKLFPQLPKQ